jgi:hypothetical protein
VSLVAARRGRLDHRDLTWRSEIQMITHDLQPAEDPARVDDR